MFLLTLMMALAFSLEDADDENYKPRVVTKSAERKIALKLQMCLTNGAVFDPDLMARTPFLKTRSWIL